MNLRTKTALLLGSLALAVSSLTAALAVPGTAQAAACGTWRWPVKTGADATRFQVPRTTSFTSIAYLDSLARPAAFGPYAQDHRIRWPEFRAWQVSGVVLVALKLEDDSDLHLRLRSADGRHVMIAEIPLPSCISSASPWKAQVTAARDYVTSRYRVSAGSWRYVYRKTDIKGLGFFDEEHGVTGAAPNQVELHPVIYMHFR